MLWLESVCVNDDGRAAYHKAAILALLDEQNTPLVIDILQRELWQLRAFWQSLIDALRFISPKDIH